MTPASVARRLRHLAARAVGSFSNADPDPGALVRADGVLTPAERVLWDRMPGRDRRHALEVLDRFDRLVPDAPRTARAAALLHDVGKVESGLTWWGRVAATIVGPRGRRFRAYCDHERIGVEMLSGISDPVTLRLIGCSDPADALCAALRAADDV